jgi:tRNA 2-thiouridine synthesizing protein A
MGSKSSTQKLHVDQSLDLRGVERVAAYLKARDQLQAMEENQILELYLDEGEPLRSIPFGLRAEGHEIVVSEPATQGVRLLVRKRLLLPA